MFDGVGQTAQQVGLRSQGQNVVEGLIQQQREVVHGVPSGHETLEDFCSLLHHPPGEEARRGGGAGRRWALPESPSQDLLPAGDPQWEFRPGKVLARPLLAQIRHEGAAPSPAASGKGHGHVGGELDGSLPLRDARIRRRNAGHLVQPRLQVPEERHLE